MICPECGSEYREGFTRCSDCDLELVEPGPSEPETELVSVYVSGNPALLPLAESLLRDGSIEFMKRGEVVQVLQGAVGMPSLVPVEFLVRKEDEEAAREILAGIEDSTIYEEEQEEEEEEHQVSDKVE